MTTGKLNDAIQKIIQHIAETGKPRAKAIRDLWKELGLRPAMITRLAQEAMRNHTYLGDQTITCKLDEYREPDWSHGRSVGTVHSAEEVEKALSAIRKRNLFGLPKISQRYSYPGRQYHWDLKTEEQTLHMLTMLGKLCIKGYRPRRFWRSVRIYGPETKRMQVNRVIKKLDRE
jgi:hypothetical protein